MTKTKNILFKHFIYFMSISALLLLIGCSLLNMITDAKADPDTEPVNNTRAVIVTVDGLSFANTLVLGSSVIENSNDYLQTNLKKFIDSESVRSFAWSGNAGDTAAILISSDSGLRKFFIDNYQEAQNANKAFIVISHSWGTVLSYLALSLEPQIECDLFITLSSPLGTSSGLPASPEKIVRDYTDAELAIISFDIQGMSFPDTKVFNNFWANGDLISGPLSGKIPAAAGVHDIKVDEGISDNRNVTDCFFWHKFTTMGDEIITVTDPSYPVYSLYLTSIGMPDITPARSGFINQITGLIQTAGGY